MPVFTFGSCTIEHDLVLAPVAGYTDSPYRRLALRWGAGFAVTELISAMGIIRDNKKTVDLLRIAPDEHPLGIQLFGNDPAIMADAAEIAEKSGSDFIDINMGCPATKVVKGGEGAGSALLRDPVLAAEIAAAVKKRVALPVTAKIRLGWDAGELTYREVVCRLEDAGVALIAVHGRTKAQGYTGEADWDAIEEIAAMTELPVVGNGDISSHAEAKQRLNEGSCTAVMIGRAAYGNPWIFSGHEPSLEERVSMVREHLGMNLEYYGDWGLMLMRKHMAKYFHGFHDASSIRKQLVTAPTPEVVYEVLDRLLV